MNCDTFKYNNKITTDKDLIANKFNDYFVNVGRRRIERFIQTYLQMYMHQEKINYIKEMHKLTQTYNGVSVEKINSIIN